MAVGCQDNNLSLNVSKTKELIVDYRKWRAEHATIQIDGAVLEKVESSLFFTSHMNYHGSHTPSQLQEGKTMPLPPLEAEKIRHGASDPQKVLQLHH